MSMYNPPHPGEFLREVYLAPFGLSSRHLASKLKVSPSTVARILQGRSSISPEMALRLSMVVGRSPESWLAMQDMHDLWTERMNVNLDDLEQLQFEEPNEEG